MTGARNLVSRSDTAVRDLALAWVTVARQLGWGVEGPEGAEAVDDVMASLARHDQPSQVSLQQARDLLRDRDLGTRPVDALHEAASLLLQADAARGARRDELLSAARGWLELARTG